MSESINDTSFRGVVRRHFHSHSITDCKPNEAFAHLSGNVRENQTLVRERDAEHGPGQDHRDGALQFNGFFRIHDGYVLGRGDSPQPPSHLCSLTSDFTGDCRQTSASRPRHADADALRADALR
jgi:hypothetical protein